VGNVWPGTYEISVSIPGGPGAPRWWLRSAAAGSRELLDAPFEIGPASTDINGLVLTFTDRHSELSGALQTATGQRVADYTIVVFSADRAHWFPGSRRLRATRPASDGQFSVADLPAGDYFIAALTDLEPDEWQQASFLDQLVPASIRVTMTEGAKVRQELRIGRGADARSQSPRGSRPR
jgi:hypothetical protein